MKRDIQGKFALKNDDYRLVRSLRLTDQTWKALGIVAECNGKTRADYLEQIVRDNTLPSITREEESALPRNIWKGESRLPCNTQKLEHPPQSPVAQMPQLETLQALRDRILLELKLGKQAIGYKVALKALNRFIAELTTRA
ncbi:hypothetical protein H6G20_05475 [Desertifilum sp. FACHB-1129]|nr:MULTISPECIES: hypothetical protein [unclassified Desertifilum]MBD2311131.1 hypothetical protein [Desertifilum sp. FACHB-1129]MBD2323998.1 hypothetical protein [Desertifilum sp. FACHB-866]MBD2333933.1 hypothetical protein [Desertifilum sp. FACHB-868]MDA0211244.1 hypothetical protein [Cyanobacteria bacterium FC1]